MRKALKTSTACVLSLSLLASHAVMPVRAQVPSNDGTAELLRRLPESNLLLRRLETLERRANEANETITDLNRRLQEQKDALEAAQVALSQALSSLRTLGEQTTNLATRAREAANSTSPEFREPLQQALAAIRSGNWTEGAPPSQVLAQIEEARRAADAVRQQFERQRSRLDSLLSGACSGSPVAAETIRQLAPFVSGQVPSHWNANLAATAASNNITLPPCFNIPNADGRSAQDELRQYMADQQASQQMASAMNSMMMVAMSTGNPYVIAAAFAVMALMAIFGEKGGGGGNGGSSRAGQGAQQGGQGVASGQPGGGIQPSPNTPPAQPGQGDPGSGVSGPPPAVSPGPGQLYENVAPGLDTWVQVQGQTLTLTDRATRTAWNANWPPTVPNSRIAVPAFSSSMRILAANAVDRTLTVEMTIPPCGAHSYEIGADPNNPGGLVITGRPADSCL